MPPSEPGAPGNTPPSTSSSTAEAKKPFWLWLLIVIGIIAATIPVLVGLFLAVTIGKLFVGDAMDYNQLLPQIESSADVTISKFQCEVPDYKWAIVEKDAIQKGNSLELGTKSQIYTYRVVTLLKGDQVLAESGSPERNDRFPIGMNFISGLVRDRSVFKTSDSEGKYWVSSLYTNVQIPQSKLSLQDFGVVSRCLFDYENDLNADLNRDAKRPAPIGWVLLMDDNIKKNKAGDVEYACEDGTYASTLGGRRIIFYKPSDTGNIYSEIVPSQYWPTIDGRIHSVEIYSGVASGGQDPSTIFPRCVDEKGQTLVDFLHSLPTRISFYQ
jgi:hypothetical protein